MSDFIADVQELLIDVISPDLFKLWSAISLVAGAMERRVWSVNRAGVTYANLFVLLVAPPGTGKGVINKVEDLWESASHPLSQHPAFKVAPHSMTKASLMDTLADAKVTFTPPNAKALTYSALNIASEEFSVLVPNYDMEYIGALNRIWNNPDSHVERRRYGNPRQLLVQAPMINLLAGTQPSYMATLFPEEAWNTGMARRLLLIYSSEHGEYDIFDIAEGNVAARSRVLERLGEMSELYGELTFTPTAKTEFRSWVRGGRKPVPTHSKLTHYISTREEYIYKLSMISSVAGGASMQVTDVDVSRAIAWLTLAESVMPDVFRAMIGRSDKDVLEELHSFAVAAFARNQSKPIDGMLLRRFLIERVPHEKVESILETAHKARMVVRIVSGGGDDVWQPRMRRPGDGVE